MFKVLRCWFQTSACMWMDASSLQSFFAPPEGVRGMKILDKEAFRRRVDVPAIRMFNMRGIGDFVGRFRKVSLNCPGILKVSKLIIDGEKVDAKKNKLLLLTPGVPLSEEDLRWVTEHEGEVTSHGLDLSFHMYSTHTVLRAILPLCIGDVPGAYETVGHIAHLNLRKEQLPFKCIIGQVMLEKAPNVRTVINKTQEIDDTYRFFKMEVLAGDNNLVATVKYNECVFSFDYSKVYWNSRLETEHRRIVDKLQTGQTVLDVFAGVGPFSIPACKIKGCQVYANDLNPHSYGALCENARVNKVSHKLKAFNLDGREFILKTTEELIREGLADGDLSKKGLFSHVIMNLPASAVEFLDVFRGLFASAPLEMRNSLELPTVHCYYFSKSDTPEEDTVEQVTRHLGSELACGYDVFTVRNVAPSKLMMRISFQLPGGVVFGSKAGKESGDVKLDDESVCHCPRASKRRKEDQD